MENYTWLLCPHCHNKTRTKIRPDTRAENLIVFCPKCKRESVVNIDGSILNLFAKLPDTPTITREELWEKYRKMIAETLDKNQG